MKSKHIWNTRKGSFFVAFVKDYVTVSSERYF